MSDIEKQAGYSRTSVTPSEESLSNTGPDENLGFIGRIVDGFKPADMSHIDRENLSEEEIQDLLTSKAPLKRSLNGTQISLIAIGGSIGSGLFISSGNSLQTGGPASVIIGFAIMGYMIFCTMQSLGTLAVHIPVQGSYVYYSSRFLSKSLGCALSWSYFQSWLCSTPLELISAAITIDYWKDDNNGATRVNKAAWVALFYVVIFAINLFGASGYGWAESALSILKVIAVVGFIIFGIVVTAGGYPKEFYGTSPDYGPGHKYLGGYFWTHPGAFRSGFKSVITVLVNAAFSYGGTELAALAAAEAKNPQKVLPRAIKQVFWRILLFFMLSLIMVGFLVPYDDPRLGTTSDGRASPFVIAISNAGVKGLPSVFNVVILLACLSVANAGVYATSRTAASMAAQGFAPKWFGFIDKKGRPMAGIGISALIGLLCFLTAYSGYGDVFNWLLALSSMSALFIWACMNLCVLRLYMAMRAQGRSTDELLFKPLGGWFTPLAGFVLNIAVIGLEFWISLFPLGEKPSAEAFFENYLSVPILIVVIVLSHFYIKEKQWFIRASDIDLDTGLRNGVENSKEEAREENEMLRRRGILYRTYRLWC